MRKVGPLAVLLLVAAVLGGCESLNPFASKKQAPLPGERIPVLQAGSAMSPDPKLKELTIALPKPRVNPAWPQAGGYPSHAMYHLALAPKISQAWRISIGSGSSKSRRLTVQPVIGAGRIYTMDARAVVRAFDAKSGNSLWEKKVLPKEEDDADIGGGVAFDGGRLYVTTGAAEVLALDAGTGKEIWRVKAAAPMRAAPTIGGGRVYVVTVQNELIAFNAKDGKPLWRHTGLPETAGFLGSASPAYANGILIVPHTSGEIYALRANNGRQLWSDTIASVRRVTAVAALTHIRGHPVIDRGRVYVVSHSGRLAAIDLRTGSRAWDLDVGALQMPWVAGKFVFILTNDGKLAALRRDNGRVKWVTELLRYVDKSKRKNSIFWVGPVLAGDRLVISGSHGEALTVSPYSGKVLGWLRLSKGVLIPPIVANGTLYILDDDGDLSAYR
ncbi:MAG: outer membrane protein assembly factor BamB family protein [Alphaproteobacteria bacterium]